MPPANPSAGRTSAATSRRMGRAGRTLLPGLSTAGSACRRMVFIGITGGAPAHSTGTVEVPGPFGGRHIRPGMGRGETLPGGLHGFLRMLGLPGRGRTMVFIGVSRFLDRKSVV